MKSILKILLYLTAGFLVLILISGISMYTYSGVTPNRNMWKTTDESPLLKADDHVFRNLNNNGQLDLHEDSRQPTDARVVDLPAQWTVAENTGMM